MDWIDEAHGVFRGNSIRAIALEGPLCRLAEHPTSPCGAGSTCARAPGAINACYLARNRDGAEMADLLDAVRWRPSPVVRVFQSKIRCDVHPGARRRCDPALFLSQCDIRVAAKPLEDQPHRDRIESRAQQVADTFAGFVGEAADTLDVPQTRPTPGARRSQ